MAETLLQKAQRLDIQPVEQPKESLLQKAQRLGIQPEPTKKRSTFGKVAEFIAPTATRAFGKLKAGERLTGRDIAGSALEVGSFFVPPAGIAKGLGIGIRGARAAKQALTLKQKAKIGAATGAISVGAFEAGRTIGEEGTTAGDVIGKTLGGAAFGTVFGAALPVGIAGAKAVPSVVRAAREKLRGAPEALKKTAEATKGVATSIAETAERVPRVTKEFFASRAETAAKIKAAPAHVKPAVKVGIEDPIIDFVRNTSQTDKIANAKMLEIAIKGKSKILTRAEDQAKVIAGRTIMQGPFAHLINTMKQGSVQTNKVLTTLGTKKQNSRPIYDQFIADMKDAGVVPAQGRLITLRGSKVPEGDLRFYQQVFDELIPDKKGVVPLTFQQLHGLRQKWFDIAKSDKTFTTGPTSYARRLRALLAQPIDAASKGKYLQAQTQTREAIEGLQGTARLMGHKGKIENLTTKDLKAGEVFLRVFGNAADRPQAILDTLYATARKYKYKGTEDPLKQLRFADFLEDIYDSPQTRALRGQVGRGVSDADPAVKAASFFREATKWSPAAAVFRLGREIVARSPDDAIRAFENMVRGEAGLKIKAGGFPARSLGQIGKETVDVIKQGIGAEAPALPKAVGAAATPKGKTAIQEAQNIQQKAVEKRLTEKQKNKIFKDATFGKKIPPRQEAFGAFAGFGIDEDGKPAFSPENAVFGIAAISGLKKLSLPKVTSAKKLPIVPQAGDSLKKHAKKFESAIKFEDSLDVLYKDSWRGDKHPDADKLKKLFKGVVFHGTDSVDGIKKAGFKDKRGFFNDGTYFSETPEVAIDYKKQNRGGGKSPGIFAVNLDNLKIKSVSGSDLRAINKGDPAGEVLISKLKRSRHDGVKSEYGEYFVWNSEKIKDPKTLEDIFNQAKSKKSNFGSK